MVQPIRSRASGGGGPQYGYPLLNEWFKKFDDKVEAIADRMDDNKEGIPEDAIKEWQEKLITLVQEASRIKNRKEKTTEVLASVLGARSRTGGEGADDSEESVKKQVMTEVGQKIKVFKPENDPQLQNLRELFSVPNEGEIGEDEDLVLVDTGMQKSETICPITGQTMVQPMKNTQCKHHLSKEGFDYFMKDKPHLKCPIAGCPKIWIKKDCKPDDDFDRKLQRFLRKAQRDAESAKEGDRAEELNNSYTKV